MLQFENPSSVCPLQLSSTPFWISAPFGLMSPFKSSQSEKSDTKPIGIAHALEIDCELFGSPNPSLSVSA